MLEGLDPTIEARNKLSDALAAFATTEEEKRRLELFKNGTFFVPDETIKAVNNLIDKITDKKERGGLLKLYAEILNKGNKLSEYVHD